MKRLLVVGLCGWMLLAGKALAESTWLEEAQSISEDLDDIVAQTMNLTEIAAVWSKKGENHRAIELLKTVGAVVADMDAVDMQIRALSEMAVVYQKAGNAELALESIQRAQALLASVEDAGERPWLLSWMSGCAARAGMMELAEALSEGIPDPSAAAESRGFIALARAEAGDWTKALKSLADIPDPSGLSWALADMLEVMVKRDPVDMERLENLLDQALEAAAQVEDPYGRATIQIRVAKVLAHAGKREQALPLLNESKPLVDSIAEYYWQIESYGLLARAFSAAGDKESALAAMEASETIVRGLTVPAARSWNQAEVAVAYAAIGEREKALERVGAVEWLTAQAWALSEIAVATAKAGETTEAIELARTIRVPSWRATALIRLAETQL